MFSIAQKRRIADEIQKLLRATEHPELPEGEIQFTLHVEGAEPWSWADISNNGAVPAPAVNPWNERESEARVSFRDRISGHFLPPKEEQP